MAHSHSATIVSTAQPPFRTELQRGFLPSNDPLVGLPEEESDFNIWLNLTIENLPKLIKEKRLRREIDAMNLKFAEPPFININKFNPDEVNAAYLVLTMLAQAYVWENPQYPPHAIPRILSENIFRLRDYCPRVPVLTYADYVLQNWRRIDQSQGLTLENVEPLFTFTGSSEEAWFIKIHVAVEAAFANAIDAAFRIHQLSLVDMEDSEFAHQFSIMAKSIEGATAVLGRMYEHCSQSFFYKILRPFLEGTDKAGGVIFHLSNNPHPSYKNKYRGSSGAQSSTLPALDAILGVKHPDDAMARSLQDFLDYMPALHREFILAMQNTQVPDSTERRRAIVQLWLFREKHKEISGQYISKPAAESGLRPEEVTGTGSTNIGLFLGKRARRTHNAAIEHGGPVAKL